MIRMLIVLAIVGLGLVLVSKSLKHVSTAETGPQGQSMQTAVQEAKRVKTLLEAKQQQLETQADRYREHEQR